MYSELACSSLLGGCSEAIKPLRHTDALEADGLEIGDELCLRQSARDSTGPEIDVAASVLGKLDVKGDVRKVKTATWL